ncbi:TolC family protein [Pollutimonas bauzanensis]|jgi:NodT family efflux transporter outer membrane factor (OMF) lipoprotein|uniref:TolC family protein n=1 Tax=Pollutimonas bauzanensis TaxID=658167 RepID=UPI003342DF2B
MAYPAIRKLCHGGLAITVALGLDGCANLTPPADSEITQQALAATPLPANWVSAGKAAEFDPAWLGFGDDGNAQALITEALTNNPDLRIAALRLEQSRLQVGIASAKLLPSVGIGAQYATDPTPGGAASSNGIGLMLSWEIDLWGRVRAERKAAEADYYSATADYAYARQSLAAATLRAWLTAILAGRQLDLIHDALADSEHQLQVIDTRWRIGQATEYDLALVKAQRQSYIDAMQSLEQSRLVALRGLEALLGRYPAASINVASTLPDVPALPTTGTPINIVERRPDMAAARKQFESMFFSVQEARAARLPALSIFGGVGRMAKEIIGFVDTKKTLYPIGASLVWPLFTGGQRQTVLEIRTVQQQEAVVKYTQTILRAMSEVENALSAESTLAARQQALRAKVVHYERAVELVRIQLRVGQVDTYDVLQQELQLNRARSDEETVLAERLVQRINLHLALGGAFEPVVPVAVANPS